MPLPHRIAVLCYLYDDDGHVLLLHRKQDPNKGMYSPVGGKLDVASGEGPHECALREIREETGVTLNRDEVRLTGIVSERAYQGEAHWLIFLFEVTRPLARDAMKWTDFKEGNLEWKRIEEVPHLPIPRTDREVMWPQVQAHRGGFFTVHIDWSAQDLTWTLHESVKGEGTEGLRD
ncbi:MAG: NUDIX hydrolase [Planctomycetota bacterium]|jgi:8-oxo-dGTP diphosphatase